MTTPLERELLTSLKTAPLTPSMVGAAIIGHRAREADGLAEAIRRQRPGLEEIALKCEQRAATLRAMALRWPATVAMDQEVRNG